MMMDEPMSPGRGLRLYQPAIAGSAGTFFFFQAEDGIRDYKVTGVQTCALPISILYPTRAELSDALRRVQGAGIPLEGASRSEERRVGKECRSRWSPYH